MKNLKIFFIIFFIGLSFSGFSQKVKFKNGDVLIDDIVWLKYQGCGFNDTECSLLNSKTEEIVFYKDIVTYSNTGERIKYIEVVFVGLNKKIEYKPFQKDLLRIFYNDKIVNEDGSLNSEKVDRLVEKYGTPFSDKLKR